MPEKEPLISMTPDLPPYSRARLFVKTIGGTPYPVYRSMADKIWEQAGNPKETVNWTNPEEWIKERLSGVEQELAYKLWRETKGTVNPRHTRGSWYLANNHNLLCREAGDHIQVTPEGNSFIESPESDLTSQIDRTEGILTILQIVSEHSPAKRGEILPAYAEFCNTFTTYRSEIVHKTSLYDRLINLIGRGFVNRSGVIYEITEAGSQYLAKYAGLIPGRSVTTVQSELNKLAQSITHETRERLKNYLSSMDPYKFEVLISLLLKEMDYDNIEVTAHSNDKGVDVTADIELGISSIHEVVQVKRHAGSINRTVLDQLRGSLYRFNAIRGTIITTGTFSSGAKTAANEQGGAPITLIDGEKLLDLLVENDIGITKKSVEFIEFDDSKLLAFEEPEKPE